MYARIAASARSSSSGQSVSRWPTKPGRNDGKHSDAHTPSMSMSATRACTSHAPRRISSKRVGSKPYSVDGRPTTALKPTFGSSWPCHIHASPPSSVATTRGSSVRELRREPAGERVGRLDHVVVDRDHRVHALARLGFGQPRDLLPPSLVARRTPRSTRDRRSTCSCGYDLGPRSPCAVIRAPRGFGSVARSRRTAPSQ